MVINMSGWAGQMMAYENQQNANQQRANEEGASERSSRKTSKKRVNTSKRNTKASYNNRLGTKSSVRNKLLVLHNSGTGNRYYGRRMRQLNRGNKQGVLSKLKKHRARKNYNSTGARSARGELLNNTITQLNKEIRQNGEKRQNREKRARNPLRLLDVSNPTNKNISRTMEVIKPSKYSGMPQSHQGGSKVRGRRVLKNGAVAGYIKQKNGTWKWSFLKRN